MAGCDWSSTAPRMMQKPTLDQVRNPGGPENTLFSTDSANKATRMARMVRV